MAVCGGRTLQSKAFNNLSRNFMKSPFGGKTLQSKAFNNNRSTSKRLVNSLI